MNKVGSVIGLRHGDDSVSAPADAGEELLLDTPAGNAQPELEPIDLDTEFLEDAPRGATRFRIIQSTLILAGAAWAGFALYLFASRDFVLPPANAIPGALSALSMPLILIGVAYLVVMRSSLGEATRFSRAAATLRHEAEALDMRLALVNQQLDVARETMKEQAGLLEHYGAAASVNLESTAGLLARHAEESAQNAGRITEAGTKLAGQFGQIIDHMPALEEKTAGMAATLADGSHALAEKVDRLEARLESLLRLTEEARSSSLAATKSLTAQLMEVQDVTRTTSDEVTGIADLAANRITTAVDRARQAVDETSVALDVRMADLNMLVDQSRTALDSIGGRAVMTFGETIEAVESRLHELNALVEGQAQLMSGIDTDLAGKIDRIDERFSRFEADGIARNQRLAETIGAISMQTERLDNALRSGNRTAEELVGRSESLLLALDASVREIDESHPAALSRLNDRIEESRALLAAATPEIEGLEAVATALFGRTREADELLRGQSQLLMEWLEHSETALAANREQVLALEEVLRSADAGARRLTDSSGPQLVAALLRIKDTADQAGERARQALSRAIAEAAGELGEASEAALNEVLGEKMTARVAEVSSVAERAVKAAHVASDRLMRQLLTIADTSASIEQRVKEAEDAAEARDRDHFARSSALLIDAMNSAAIDISKSLSGDVSDSSWAAYLKGDRGVFTRRAVRLLDNGEARSISALYDENAKFREQVNVYIHDFEAMLRTILATRDGGSLAVTLLSSDMGKLYVALAQAIDRLRG